MPEGDKKDMREFKLYCDTCKKITIFRNIDDDGNRLTCKECGKR